MDPLGCSPGRPFFDPTTSLLPRVLLFNPHPDAAVATSTSFTAAAAAAPSTVCSLKPSPVGDDGTAAAAAAATAAISVVATAVVPSLASFSTSKAASVGSVGSVAAAADFAVVVDRAGACAAESPPMSAAVLPFQVLGREPERPLPQGVVDEEDTASSNFLRRDSTRSAGRADVGLLHQSQFHVSGQGVVDVAPPPPRIFFYFSTGMHAYTSQAITIWRQKKRQNMEGQECGLVSNVLRRSLRLACMAIISSRGGSLKRPAPVRIHIRTSKT